MIALQASLLIFRLSHQRLAASALWRAFAQALHKPLEVGQIIANEEISNEGGKVDGVSNEFEVLQGDWVQVAPYGQFPHSAGLQYFDRSDAEKLVANFASLKARILRRFAGLPWYEGHPDTSPKDYANKKAYGWIDQVEARADGLYGHVKWTRAGNEMIQEGHYKFFSPVWHVQIGNVGGKRVLRPDELISVGFTNMPNMPVLPLSNELTTTADEDTMKLPPPVLKMLGFAEGADPTPEEITAAVEKLAADAENAANTASTLEGSLANATSTHESALANLRSELETSHTEALANAKKEADDRFNAERSEVIELLIGSALANGKITAADTDKWRADLLEDFAGKKAELANARPVIKTTAITANLGEQQSALEAGGKPGEQLRALANEIRTTKKIPFDKAWSQAKTQRPDLVAGMKQPGGAQK